MFCVAQSYINSVRLLDWSTHLADVNNIIFVSYDKIGLVSKRCNFQITLKIKQTFSFKKCFSQDPHMLKTKNDYQHCRMPISVREAILSNVDKRELTGGKNLTRRVLHGRVHEY